MPIIYQIQPYNQQRFLMSRFMQSNDNAYVQFRFQNSLRKYQRKPTKKVKQDILCEHACNLHRKSTCPSPLSLNKKPTNTEKYSENSFPSQFSKQFSRIRPLGERTNQLQRKIYSDLRKDLKESEARASQGMEDEVLLNDFNMSDMMDEKEVAQDHEFGNIELALDSQYRLEEGQWIVGVRSIWQMASMMDMAPIGQVPQFSSERRSVKMTQGMYQQSCKADLQQAQASKIVKQNKEDMQCIQMVHEWQQDKQIIQKSMNSEQKDQKIEFQILEQKQQKNLVKQCLPQIIFQSRQISFQPKSVLNIQPLKNGQLCANQLIQQPFENYNKQQFLGQSDQHRVKVYMTFEGGRIGIVCSGQVFYLSLRVFKKLLRQKVSLNSLVEDLIHQRPYLNEIRTQIFKELQKHFG